MKRRNKKEDLPTEIFKKIPKEKIPSDVLGSYVGIDADGEAPVQDADDL